MSSHSHSASSVKRHGSMSSSSHPRGHHGDISHHELSHTLPAHHHYDTEWEAKEELRLRELEEARARAAQMEKTMRWWSDCTANWREKWSKVRTERNKAREESRIFRTKLEASLKECNTLKREKQEMENELERLRNETEYLKSQKSLNNNGPSETIAPERDVPLTPVENEKNVKESQIGEDNEVEGSDLKCEYLDQEIQFEEILCKSQLVQTSPTESLLPLSGLQLTPDAEFCKLWQLKPEKDNDMFEESFLDKSNTSEAECEKPDEDMEDSTKSNFLKMAEEFPIVSNTFTEHQILMLQMHLDESSKTLQNEREEKNVLNKTLEKLQEELNELKLKYDDLKQSKQEAIKELTQLKAEHQDALINIRLDLEDEANSRSSMDRRLADLRSQLEALQAENAAEWGKRERLETDKLTLERENKKLKTHIDDLEERLERKNKQFTAAADSDLKALQQDIYDKNKELADLKHSHNKLKKALQDKTTELGHSVRRAEQYEAEVKKLRFRVEELKKELAAAEDEVDSATNNIRKLQRTNDELQEQVESLQVQVEHLQTRLRSTNHSLISRRGSPGILQSESFIEDDNNEY